MVRFSVVASVVLASPAPCPRWLRLMFLEGKILAPAPDRGNGNGLDASSLMML